MAPKTSLLVLGSLALALAVTVGAQAANRVPAAPAAPRMSETRELSHGEAQMRALALGVLGHSASANR